MEIAAGSPAPFTIVYRDERVIVLDKPSGLLSVPGRGPDLQDCLSARVQIVHSTACVVHRLDRDTSGLMAMALDADAQRELNRQFAERLAEKRYIAIVLGEPQEESGLIDLPMRKDFERPPRHMIDPQFGKPAQTAWRVLERQGNRTRLELRPLTGRSHQLRLHLASLGWPILGDNLYATPDALAASPRLLLHAEELTLFHPDDGRRCTWRTPAPF
ncbi:MAG TPA: RluA family pseudouridine synthase [Pirellulales bacterium]